MRKGRVIDDGRRDGTLYVCLLGAALMPNHHEPCHEIRDPIYGFVKLSKAEWAIVNSSPFQRLRDIRQLAMGYMVYPGANHTRFEHSIGCLHLSTLMFDALAETERNQKLLAEEFQLSADVIHRAKQLLRLSALLHDIGHPPFSHSGEELLPPKTDDAGNPEEIDGKIRRLSHEYFSAQIICKSEISEIINHFYGPQGISLDEVAAVATDFGQVGKFKAHAYHGFLHEMLTGELGSDRIDYLLRDAYHSGQKSGEFDYRRLVSCVTLVRPPGETGDTLSIGFDAGGWLVAEQMIVSRYLMYQSLYFHKTKRIYEIHMEEFMKAWVKHVGLGDSLPGELADYLAISDSDIIGGLHLAAKDKTVPGHNIAKRFQDRSHFRLAKEVILADNFLQESSKHRLPCTARFAKLNSDVSNTFGINNVICDEPNHSATKIFGDTGKILVSLGGNSRYLDDISEIVSGMSSKIWRGRIYAEKNQIGPVKKWCEDWLQENPTAAFSQGGR